ncbi:MAG TPA: hypothetical protein ENJ50_04070 [Planctomycetaceae bacterium]|nr:hypothetical protein [Planctomycetaceae bacterium]
MSIGPTPPAGNIAGSPLSQRRASETDQSKEASDQQRTVRNDQRSAQADGIGETEGDAEAEDRDADGRMPWKRSGQVDAAEESNETPDDRPRARDPDGQRGSQLDLSG